MTYHRLIRSAQSLGVLVFAWATFAIQAAGQNSPPLIHQSPQTSATVNKTRLKLRRVRVNGVELHYIESGKGVPVVFVHGSLDNYSMWQPQVGPFAERYRVIAYSRRYNHPNNNPHMRPGHSAIVEAEDLAALIKKLKLGRVHVVGHSYGALTALVLAVKYPEMVGTLVLAEPPVLSLAEEKPEGRALSTSFMEGTWKPIGQAFRMGNRVKAMRLTLRYFMGGDVYDEIPEAQREYWMSNIREWHALATSHDAFPAVPRSEIKRIKIPVMMLSGGRTLALLKFVDAELEPLLANGERVVLPNATHEMWAEQPEESRRVVLAFLARH